MTVEKPKPKQLLRPITTGADSAMNQSQFLAITCNSLKEREKSRMHGAIGFRFASHWLKNWRESFKPISKHSNRNHVITFDSHLKTALLYSAAFPSFETVDLTHSFQGVISVRVVSIKRYLVVHMVALRKFGNSTNWKEPLPHCLSLDT